MALQIQTSVSGQTARIALSGRFDFTSQQQLRAGYEAPLDDEGVRLVEIDLGGVAFLDSTAMGLLLLLKERATGADKELVLTNCQGAPLLVLKMAHFDRIFTMECSSPSSCAFHSHGIRARQARRAAVTARGPAPPERPVP